MFTTLGTHTARVVARTAASESLRGGAGRDTILDRDKTGDRIDCGPGRDKVVADRKDKLRRCERVRRRKRPRRRRQRMCCQPKWLVAPYTRQDYCALPTTTGSTEPSILYEEDGDGWIVASIPEVPGVFSQGRTRDEARTNVLDALQLVTSPEPCTTDGHDDRRPDV